MTESYEARVDPADVGKRLDAFLAAQLKTHGYSRVWLQRAISEGGVSLDGQVADRRDLRLKAGQRVLVALSAVPAGSDDLDGDITPENIPFPIIHMDNDIIVVDKPPGLPVHPGPGHATGTLAHGLRRLAGESLSEANGRSRPGIVHRLDMDTSGVLVVARHDRAHHMIASQFQNRTTNKVYLAIVEGNPGPQRGRIDLPIRRHPTRRKRMAVVRHPIGDEGRNRGPRIRDALTEWQIVESLGAFSLLRIQPRTGRTHQIRVHLASQRLPILCDATYGRRSNFRIGDGHPLTRHALHAAELSFDHPGTKKRVTFHAPLPDDLEATLTALRKRNESSRP